MTAASWRCRTPGCQRNRSAAPWSLPFGDLKDEIDAIVAAVDDLGHHADIVAPHMPIGFDDAADVGLHRALQRATRLGFDHRPKLFVLDLLVAFKGDAIQHRSFGEVHDQSLALALDRDFVEQAGADQRFERGVARGLVKCPSGAAWKYERTVSASMRRLPATIDPRRVRLSDAGAEKTKPRATAIRPRLGAAGDRLSARAPWILTSRLLPLTGAIEMPARGKRMSEIR